MEEVGGDGFLFFNSYFDRRYVIDVRRFGPPFAAPRSDAQGLRAHRHLEITFWSSKRRDPLDKSPFTAHRFCTGSI